MENRATSDCTSNRQARCRPFVDAHMHLWSIGSLRYPWLTPPFRDHGPNGNVEPIAHDYCVDDYLADVGEYKPVAAVHVEAGAHPDDGVAECRWLANLAPGKGYPNAVVAHAALEMPGVLANLEMLAGIPLVRGVRQIMNWHSDPRRTYTSHDISFDPAWRKGFSLLKQFNLSFDLQCYPGQVPALSRILMGEPGTPVAVNHMGMPVLTDPAGLQEWRNGMRLLAQLPQVKVKISGFGFLDRQWTVDVVRPIIRELVDVFGPGRLMCGSDFPTDKLFSSATRYMSVLDEILSEYSDEECSLMLASNALDFYRMHPDQGGPAWRPT